QGRRRQRPLPHPGQDLPAPRVAGPPSPPRPSARLARRPGRPTPPPAPSLPRRPRPRAAWPAPGSAAAAGSVPRGSAAAVGSVPRGSAAAVGSVPRGSAAAAAGSVPRVSAAAAAASGPRGRLRAPWCSGLEHKGRKSLGTASDDQRRSAEYRLPEASAVTATEDESRKPTSTSTSTSRSSSTPPSAARSPTTPARTPSAHRRKTRPTNEIHVAADGLVAEIAASADPENTPLDLEQAAKELQQAVEDVFGEKVAEEVKDAAEVDTGDGTWDC
ncbi:unnamed protein product, partial [Sphagnum tenellum]